MESCPLCKSFSCTRYVDLKTRRVHECESCGLWFVPSVFHCSKQAEKARYALHDNSASNLQYLAYLAPVAKKIARLCDLVPHGNVLDFGCGENAVLSSLLKEQNYVVDSYDPMYELQVDFKSRKYSVVVASEVMEHVADLRATALLFGNVLSDGGYIALRTKLFTRATDFALWWYAKDPTHICFFTKKSIDFFATLCGCTVLDSDEVAWIILQKR